jgi:hypothetical protein
MVAESKILRVVIRVSWSMASGCLGRFYVLADGIISLDLCLLSGIIPSVTTSLKPRGRPQSCLLPHRYG